MQAKKSTAPLFAPEPPRERPPFWWLRWVPAVILTILVLDLLYILGSVALVPVMASFAMAYLLNPLVSQGERRGLSGPVAAAVALLAVAVAVIGFFTFVIPELIDEG